MVHVTPRLFLVGSPTKQLGFRFGPASEVAAAEYCVPDGPPCGQDLGRFFGRRRAAAVLSVRSLGLGRTCQLAKAQSLCFGDKREDTVAKCVLCLTEGKKQHRQTVLGAALLSQDPLDGGREEREF